MLCSRPHKILAQDSWPKYRELSAYARKSGLSLIKDWGVFSPGPKPPTPPCVNRRTRKYMEIVLANVYV